MGDNHRKRINKIPTNLFSRGFSLAKMTARAGVQTAFQGAKELLAGQEITGQTRLQRVLASQMDVIADELGKLKGTALKAGQSLALFGEYILPRELTDVLKKLQDQSPALNWSKVEPILVKAWGRERLAELDIEQEAFAAASLGQVHRAVVRSTGEVVCLKIQYPGVADAIDMDLKAIRALLKASRWVPSGDRLDSVFAEVRTMLAHELDFKREAQWTEKFYHALKADDRYRVPRVFSEWSTDRILVTEYVQGEHLSSDRVNALSVSDKARLGEAILELYFRELFEFNAVQTDPHFGNYRIDLSSDRPKFVLFDFGAVRELEPGYVDAYWKVMKGSVERDRECLIDGLEAMGMLLPQDSLETLEKFVEMSFLVAEPFQPELKEYDWGKTDLPKRVSERGPALVFATHLRPPPPETVFVDRKMAGVFLILHRLGVTFSGHRIVAPFIERRPSTTKSG